MGRSAKTLEQETSAPLPDLAGLSKRGDRFVRSNPRQARLVVVAALEGAAALHEAEAGTTAVDVPDALEPFVVPRRRGPDMVGVSEAAKRLQVSRTTVYDWVEKGTLLGWRSTKRDLTIPVEQVLGPGNVVPGLRDVLEIIEDPELTWEFLSNEWPFENDVARPVDKLKAGETEEVIASAPGFGTDFA